MSTSAPRSRALPLVSAPLFALPLLLIGLRSAAGADPAPMHSGAPAICACADHDPACLDEAWPSGGPLLDQLAACEGQSEGACAAEALIDLAALDQPACLPEGYVVWLRPGGGAMPSGVGLGFFTWSTGIVAVDLKICREVPVRKLDKLTREACYRAGLIGDTEDGGYPEIADPGPGIDDDGWDQAPDDEGTVEDGGQDTGG
jgi:hypothetical protein